MPRLIEILHKAIVVLEVGVVVALVVIAAMLLVTLGFEIWHQLEGGVVIGPGDFNEIIGTILEIFIVVELFRIATAYMRHQNVIPTVLEAALVAVARKFVVFEGAENYLAHAAGLASLLAAVAVSWYLLEKSNACELHD